MRDIVQFKDYKSAQPEKQRNLLHIKQIMDQFRGKHGVCTSACSDFDEHQDELCQMIGTLRESLAYKIKKKGGGLYKGVKIARDTALAMLIGPWAIQQKRVTSLGRFLHVGWQTVKNAALLNSLVKRGIKEHYLASYRKKNNKNKIPEEHLLTARMFWEQYAVPSPSAKDVRIIRESDSTGQVVKREVCVRYCDFTEASLYVKFRETYPEVKLGIKLFNHARPPFVKSLNEKKRLTCTCITCINMEYLVRAMAGVTQLLSGLEVLISNKITSKKALTSVCLQQRCCRLSCCCRSYYSSVEGADETTTKWLGGSWLAKEEEEEEDGGGGGGRWLDGWVSAEWLRRRRRRGW
ncbi:hypothetical protein CEUSTIGMA_g12902.t1 [Chlamydomonas eustigma]|uniref:Uncharacterized protein n=1 Tax=Chlamydomonas eustigma TaxID=1157962 RepID=A0A250XR13_9CHLO|nr:hypothetical protein CEUSTIGMA_g12902.t1 [Chlamydomonas eustigma]|eukprot:GAX85486.1 hypothetical protein CEUSTIGMA_g12902.t1 [Chlamydomonas eustigma]